jgi:hypothetical protein
MSIFSHKELPVSGTISFPWEEMVNSYLNKFKSAPQSAVNARFPVPLAETKVEETAQEMFPNSEVQSSGNMLLDMYCLEGMKLFNQGPFAANRKPKSEDGL